MAYPFELPELGFDYDALEPHIDARTMEIHHSKHHAGYTKKLNAALEGHEELHGYSAEQLLRGLPGLPGRKVLITGAASVLAEIVILGGHSWISSS